jgi:hypothetical protein
LIKYNRNISIADGNADPASPVTLDKIVEARVAKILEAPQAVN